LKYIKNNKMNIVKAIVISFILAINFINIVDIANADQGKTDYSYSFSFPKPDLKNIYLNNIEFTQVSVPGSISIGDYPGAPAIPYYPIKIVLPFNTHLQNIHVEGEMIEFIQYKIDIKEKPIIPYQHSAPIGDIPPFVKDEDIYSSRETIPGKLYDNLDVNYCRGYSILTISLYPVSYIPVEGRIYYTPEIIVKLELEETNQNNEFFRGNTADEDWVKSLVINPEIVENYIKNNPAFSPTFYPGGLCQPFDNNGEGYDYVIITRESLADFTAEYNWTDFINRKSFDGLDTILVTVEDIQSCSDYWNSNPLFNDTAALIREFCKDAYEDWSLQYVLIAGDQDGTAAIPRRLMDYAYESNVETDLYWSNLDNTFNNDGDNNWGEEGDTGFDLYSELFIGSIPCDVPIDISNWMKKSFYYADSVDKDYLENAAFYGGDTGWDCQGDDFIDYSAIKGTNDWLGPNPHNDGPYPSWVGFQYGFETWNSENPGREFNLSVKWTAEPPNPGGWQWYCSCKLFYGFGRL